MIKACPVCEGQGNIYKAKILDLGIDVKICDECEACWLKNHEIRIDNFKGLTSFLKEHGLTYKDSNIEDMGYLEEDDK